MLTLSPQRKHGSRASFKGMYFLLTILFMDSSNFCCTLQWQLIFCFSATILLYAQSGGSGERRTIMVFKDIDMRNCLPFLSFEHALGIPKGQECYIVFLLLMTLCLVHNDWSWAAQKRHIRMNSGQFGSWYLMTTLEQLSYNSMQ